MQYVGETTRFCIVNTERDALRVIGRAPLRTIRAVDLADVYAHPGAELASMQRRGVVHRLAHGIYCAVPPEHLGTHWRPTLEATTAAIATALYGDRVPVLTGLTAARAHETGRKLVCRLLLEKKKKRNTNVSIAQQMVLQRK